MTEIIPATPSPDSTTYPVVACSHTSTAYGMLVQDLYEDISVKHFH
jgi:hypothetical protein